MNLNGILHNVLLKELDEQIKKRSNDTIVFSIVLIFIGNDCSIKKYSKLQNYPFSNSEIS